MTEPSHRGKQRQSLSHIWELPQSVTLPDDERILFFRRDRSQYFWLSHFYESPIVLDGEQWPTVEHYFQSQKSFDSEYRAVIRACVHPGMAKRLAAAPEGPKKTSGQSWFRANGKRHREDWRDVRLDIMRRADRAKYLQNPRLKELLIATGTAEIIEDTTMDDYWGIGPDGQGENWAGRILMEVRDTLKSESVSIQPQID